MSVIISKIQEVVGKDGMHRPIHRLTDINVGSAVRIKGDTAPFSTCIVTTIDEKDELHTITLSRPLMFFNKATGKSELQEELFQVIFTRLALNFEQILTARENRYDYSRNSSSQA